MAEADSRDEAVVTQPAFRVREATPGDISLIANQRAAMFRDMGTLASGTDGELVRATEHYLLGAVPRGEYLGWIAALLRHAR